MKCAFKFDPVVLKAPKKPCQTVPYQAKRQLLNFQRHFFPSVIIDLENAGC